MIIDAILDRQDGFTYSAENEKYILEEAKEFNLEYLVSAFSSKEPFAHQAQYAKQKALIQYVLDNDYDLEIIPYILSVNW